MTEKRRKKLIASFEGLNLTEAKRRWNRLKGDDKLIIVESIALGIIMPPVLPVLAFIWAVAYKEKAGEVFGRAKKILKEVI